MLCDYSKLVTLYKLGEVYFRLLGMIGFHVKGENDRFSAAVRTSNMKISRLPLADYVKKLHQKRSAHAARLFFLIQPIKSLICDVVVAVAPVNS